MPSFQDRLDQAALLEAAFIENFNKACATHRIVKFGFESTQLSEVHQHIRFADDPTSHFVRYLPDSALVRTTRQQPAGSPQIALVEFKRQQVLIYADSFFNRVRAAYGDGQPPLREKQDIFNMERDALNVYRSIQELLGVQIVVVALQVPRLPNEDALRAQFATEIVVCKSTQTHVAGGATHPSPTFTSVVCDWRPNSSPPNSALSKRCSTACSLPYASKNHREDIVVDGVEIGWIEARLNADGRIEFAITLTGGERILPQQRHFPANPRTYGWLRSEELNLSE